MLRCYFLYDYARLANVDLQRYVLVLQQASFVILWFARPQRRMSVMKSFVN